MPEERRQNLAETGIILESRRMLEEFTDDKGAFLQWY